MAKLQKKELINSIDKEVDWLQTGFSPGKVNLSLYISVGIKKHAVAL